MEGIARDITEQKATEAEREKLERRLQREEKMRSLGLMAGGIAHDLNNILSGIVSYPDLLLMDLPADSPLRKPVETIKSSGLRATEVVSDLLTIARGVTTGKAVRNLNRLIEEYLDSAEHRRIEAHHSGVRFCAELDPDLLNTSCSTVHIKKILMNLAANAAEAIADKGMVTVATRNRYLDTPLRGYAEIRCGEYVMLSVSDDGTGIPHQRLERIFEPFYTKKVLGRSGTGLGLAVVWNAVQDHDGYINVTSGAQGTVFDLYFPMVREEIAVDPHALPLSRYAGTGQRVLVVDDEPDQCALACRMLARLGYRAESVSSGEAALVYLQDNAVDLIVLDMIMAPGMDGLETFRRILDRHPGQRAVITSGYSETDRVREAQSLGAGEYVKKPYLLETIGMAVKMALNR